MEPLAHALVRGLVFEVVIAKGDVKLRHLARNPPCVLVVFGAVQPFRGVEVRGEAELVEGDVTSARVAIAGRRRADPSDHGGGRWASRWPPRPSDRDRKVVG